MRSIRAKIFVAFVVCIVAAAAIVGFASYTISSDVVKRQAVQAATTAADQAGDKLELRLRAYEQIAKQIAVDPEIGAGLTHLNAGTDSAARLQAQGTILAKLSSYQFAGEGIANLYLLPVDEGFKSISTATFTFKDELRSEDWFRSLADSSVKAAWVPTTSSGLLGVSNAPVFSYLRLIDAASAGGHAMLLLVELKATVLDEALGELAASGAERVLLASADHTIFADTESANVGAAFTAEGLSEWLVAEGDIPVANWKLASMTRWSALTAQVDRILKLTIIITAVSAAVAVAVAYGIARMIGRPIAELSQLMKSGESGDFSGRATLDRKDEIGQLAAGYNAMADRIAALVEGTRQAADGMAEHAWSLNEFSKQSETTASQVAAATGEIAVGASNLAEEAEKGMAYAQHIEERMAESDQACRSLEHSAAEVLEASHQGESHLRLLDDKATAAERMIAQLLSIAGRFADSTGEIGRVLGLLEDISKRTEILSLNASIESTRSQEGGRGFKVIADEVRQLAHRSKDSINEVRRITDRVQGDAHDTIELLRKAQPLFSEQLQATRAVLEIIGGVAGQMEQFRGRLNGMAEGNRRLGEAQRSLIESVGEVGATSQQAAASSEQVAMLGSEQLAASAKLVSLAEELRELSNHLQHSLSDIVTRK